MFKNETEFHQPLQTTKCYTLFSENLITQSLRVAALYLLGVPSELPNTDRSCHEGKLTTFGDAKYCVRKCTYSMTHVDIAQS